MYNTTTPRISIIMPTYNRAGYILETIESIRQQTYSNWELIIVDDGSDDETGELVSAINDERIQFCKAGRIGINGKIKNIGLEKASGELVAFIDSDDLWAATKLEKQVAALQQYGGAGFSLTGGYNFRRVNEPVDFFYKERDGVKYGDVFVSFFRSELSTTTPSLMLRRECLEISGGFDETRPFSDVDFILGLARHFKAVILFEPLLYRRLHEANDSSSNWKKGYEEGIRLIRTYKSELPRKVAREAVFRLYMNFGEDWLAQGQTKKAINNFFKGWRNKPFSIIPLKKMGKTIVYYFKKEHG